jgi:hypothetical protein
MPSMRLRCSRLRGSTGRPPRFDSLKSVTVYILNAAIAATAVACALAAFLFVLTAGPGFLASV